MCFITLDFANDYWHMLEEKEKDKEKMTFTMNNQTFEFNVCSVVIVLLFAIKPYMQINSKTIARNISSGYIRYVKNNKI